MCHPAICHPASPFHIPFRTPCFYPFLPYLFNLFLFLAGRACLSLSLRSTGRRFLSSSLPAASTSASSSSLLSPLSPRRPLSTASPSSDLDSLGSVDHSFETDRVDRLADPEKRAFTYFLLGGARFAYASAARVILIKFVSSMSASADVLALASAEFELGEIPQGGTITVKWRGKPIFIKNRTADEISEAEGVALGELRDQEVREGGRVTEVANTVAASRRATKRRATKRRTQATGESGI